MGLSDSSKRNRGWRIVRPLVLVAALLAVSVCAFVSSASAKTPSFGTLAAGAAGKSTPGLAPPGRALAALNPTSTRVTCNPNPVFLHQPTTCTALITDTAGGPVPKGEVGFNTEADGTFPGGQSCEEVTPAGPSQATCTVTYKPEAFTGSDTHELLVSFEPLDGVHEGSEDIAEVELRGQIRNTVTSFECGGFVELPQSAGCKVEVRDTTSNPTTPEGQVSFEIEGLETETFEPPSCGLTPVEGEVGVASCTTQFLPDRSEAEKTLPLGALYHGDERHLPSAGRTEVFVQIAPHKTRLELECSPADVEPGATVICTIKATDISEEGDASPPTEVVGFVAHGLGSTRACELEAIGAISSSCQVSYVAESLQASAGKHLVVASYFGGEGHEGGAGHEGGQAQFEVGIFDASSTTVICTPPAVESGKPSTCTAVVTDTSAAPVLPGGEAQFASSESGTFPNGESCELKEVKAAPNSASCSIVYKPVNAGSGKHKITGTYPGDGNHSKSSGSGTVEVGTDTESKVSCDRHVVLVGQTTSCALVVTDKAIGNPSPPTGSVELGSAGAGDLSPCNLIAAATNASECKFDYTPRATGTGLHTLEAKYGSDGVHRSSHDSVTLTVNPEGGATGDPSTTSLSCVPTHVPVKSSTRCTVTVEDIAAQNRAHPGGDVTFSSDGEGDFSAPGCTLPGGSGDRASCLVEYRPSAIGAAPHHITASYHSDGALLDGSGAFDLVVDPEVIRDPKDPTTTKVRCTPSALDTSEPATCVATVEDNAASDRLAPTGRVVFKAEPDGVFSEAATCTLTRVSEGEAVCQLSFSPTVAGEEIVSGSYEGDGAHERSRGSDQLQIGLETPVLVPTSTKVECTPAALQTSQSATCTATVSEQGTDAPQGRIELESDERGVFTSAAVCRLKAAGSGEGSCQFSYIPSEVGSGTHRIFATYEGDGVHRISQGQTALTVSLETAKLPRTTTTVACESSRFEFGNETGCEITVSDESAAPTTPGGEVQLDSNRNGTFPDGAGCELQPGAEADEASCSLSYKPGTVGAHKLFATYEGDEAHRLSQGTARLNVGLAETKTKVDCQPDELTVGQGSDCEVRVEDLSGAATEIGGVVNLESDHGGNFSGGGSCEVHELEEGEFGCQVSFRPTRVGRHLITAKYEGDPSHLGSESVAPVEVQAVTTTTTVSCQPNLLRLGRSSECEVTVDDNAEEEAAVPSGDVSLTSEGEADRSCELVAAEGGEPTASCIATVTPAERGPHRITATYPGSETRAGSEGSDLITVESKQEEEEEDGPTETRFSCDSPVQVGSTAHCTATVTDITQGNKTQPTGEVHFSTAAPGEFSEPSCTLPDRVEGQDSASCNIDYLPTALGSGTHTLHAAYDPGTDTGHEASAADFDLTVEEEVVTPPTVDQTETKLSCDSPVQVGSTSHCTATVKDIATTGATQPTGEVHFSTAAPGEFSEPSCTLPDRVEGQDSASCNIDYLPTALGTGTHTLHAAYDPGADTGHEASAADFDLTVEEEEVVTPPTVDQTETKLICDSPITVGATSHCTAMVKDIATTGATQPTGEVHFSTAAPGEFSEPSCTLPDRVEGQDSASCNIDYLPTALGSGTHTLHAAYDPGADTGHEASAADFDLTVEEEVVTPPTVDQTETKLSCDSPVQVGSTSHCTATVKDIATTGATQPTGEVHFSTAAPGEFSEPSCTLPDRVEGQDSASCNIDYLPTALGSGTHTLHAAYDPGADTGHEASAADFDLTVEEEVVTPPTVDQTETKLSCDSPVQVGSTSHCTATVKDIATTGATQPTGEVHFSTVAPGEFSEPSCTLPDRVEGQDSASCNIDYLPTALGTGTHTLHAAYDPGADTGHEASAADFDLTVEEALTPPTVDQTETKLSCDSPVQVGSTSHCTATVKDIATTGATQPTGEVHFSTAAPGEFSEPSCTLPDRVEGQDSASCNIDYLPTALGTGTHTLHAAYDPGADTGHEASAADFDLTVEEEVVTPPTVDQTETKLSCDSPITVGATSHCTATVKDIATTGATQPTGEVHFSTAAPGEFSEPSCTLPDRVEGQDSASCNIDYLPTALGTGTHTLHAAYDPGADADHEASAADFDLTVEEEVVTPPTVDQTETKLSCDSPITVGATSHCTATVKDIATTGATQPTGEVHFSTAAPGEFSEPSCTLPDRVEGQDSASCNIDYLPTALGTGTHTLHAAYDPGTDADHEASAADFDLTVEEEVVTPPTVDQTETKLECNPTQLVFGGASACTVTVKDTASTDASAPSGEVKMSAGSGEFANPCHLVQVATDTASCQSVYLSKQVGADTVEAEYEGDDGHGKSTDTAQLQVAGPNGGHQTAATLTCEPDTVILGGAAVCTVDVEDSAANPASPGGLVVFAASGGGSFRTGGCTLFTIGNGKSRCQVIYKPSAAGQQTITAIYSGDPTHEPTLTTSQLDVSAPNGGHRTTTTLSCQPSPVALGGSTDCTATVADAETNGTTPKTAVIFASEEAGTFDKGGCQLTGAGTEVSCHVSYTPAKIGSGRHEVTAIYVGDAGHLPSEGGAQVTVTEAPPAPHPTTTAITCTPSPALIGAAATCTATVTDTAQGASVPSGTVKFQSDGGGAFSSAAACALAAAGPDRASCQVTYAPSVRGTGSHRVTAAYQGDPSHLASQAGFALAVIQAPVTSFAKRPKPPRRKTSARVARFGFLSDQAGSTFQCKLDKRAFKPCKSAFKVKVKPGKHVLQVRAVSPQSVVDPTPAKYTWTVLGRAAKRR